MVLANPLIHESGTVECIKSKKSIAVPASYPVLA